jgi:hypothetical protein
MPTSYPDWVKGVTLHTHKDAKPSRTRFVRNVPVIRVTGATYRGCAPIDGVFELVDRQEHWLKGECCYEVYCAWFGVKPYTVFPRIIVNPKGCEIVENYTGEVIDNLSA